MTFLRVVAWRLLASVPVLLTVLTLIFIVVHVLPGDPAQAALGENASANAVSDLRTRLGLDAPLPIQYARFLTDLVRGDLGVSMITSTPVRDEIAHNLPFTLQLTVASLCVGLTLGIPLGVCSAVRHNALPDLVIRVLSLAGLSVPAFYLAILLVLAFSIQLRWLPAIGASDSASLVLPALTLGLVMTASLTRLVRTAVLETLGNDFVRTARAKGLRERAVIVVHTLRPSLVPVVALSGVWTIALIGDSVTTELVFARPGLGKLLVGAMLQRDYTSVQSVMVVYTLLVVTINAATDIAYRLVDPRTRTARA